MILNEKDYIKEETKKTQIVLHHTVSSTGISAIEWWKLNKERVATAYILEKNGDIINVFDDKYWAWHIGKGSSRTNNKTSIGIEIVNEGTLTIKDKKFYWCDGKYEFKGDVVIGDPWRGYTQFAAYSELQKIALVHLLIELCEKHNIPKNIITDYQYNKEYLNFKGIVSHHNLRPDKTDVSRALNLAELHAKINGV